MNSFEESMKAQLAKINGSVGTMPAEETFAQQSPVSATVEIPVQIDPIVKTSTVVVQEQTVKDSAPDKIVSFEWAKTRLNLIMIQNDGAQNNPAKLFSHNGSQFYLNKPFNSYEENGQKYAGYLMSNLPTFLDQIAKLVDVNQKATITTNAEMVEYFTVLLKTVMTNMQRVLPKIDGRFEVYGSIDKEKNSLVDKVVVEFYLVYRTDYTAEETFARAQKHQTQLGKYVSNTFEVVSTFVYDLDNFPDNLIPWKELGYSVQNYNTTNALPVDKEVRLSVLGNLPETKRLKPAIVLTKSLPFVVPQKKKS